MGLVPGDAVLTVPTSVLRRQAQSDHTGVLADVDGGHLQRECRLAARILVWDNRKGQPCTVCFSCHPPHGSSFLNRGCFS